MKNTMIKNSLILTLITVVAGLLLGLVYEITKEPIAIAKEHAKQEAFKEVFQEADRFEMYDEFEPNSATAILEEAGYPDDSIQEVVIAMKGEEAIGYVVTVVSHEGYAGDITFTMGVTNEGVLNAISILTISETAGLGMKANDAEFKDQFKDKDVDAFTVTKTKAQAENEIDAISGATITSDAMANGVNAGLAYVSSIAGGGTNE